MPYCLGLVGDTDIILNKNLVSNKSSRFIIEEWSFDKYLEGSIKGDQLESYKLARELVSNTSNDYSYAFSCQSVKILRYLHVQELVPDDVPKIERSSCSDDMVLFMLEYYPESFMEYVFEQNRWRSFLDASQELMTMYILSNISDQDLVNETKLRELYKNNHFMLQWLDQY